MKPKIILSIVALIILMVVFGGFWFWKNSQTSSQANENQNWITTTNEELKIRFKHPRDTSISEVEKTETNVGIINKLTITPKGVDPTRVYFFTTHASLEEAKNIKIYPLASIARSEFTNEKEGIRRIDYYSRNTCANELFVFEANEMVYGYHLTQCETHPQGYDKLRRDIVNSLEIL